MPNSHSYNSNLAVMMRAHKTLDTQPLNSNKARDQVCVLSLSF